MLIYIEVWKPKKEWLDLSQPARAEYIGGIGGAIESLIAAGVEIITWSFNDKETDHHNGYDYFAVWKFPNAELVKAFETAVSEAGWYTYFEQVNACGPQGSPQDVLGHSISL